MSDRRESPYERTMRQVEAQRLVGPFDAAVAHLGRLAEQIDCTTCGEPHGVINSHDDPLPQPYSQWHYAG